MKLFGGMEEYEEHLSKSHPEVDQEERSKSSKLGKKLRLGRPHGPEGVKHFECRLSACQARFGEKCDRAAHERDVHDGFVHECRKCGWAWREKWIRNDHEENQCNS